MRWVRRYSRLGEHGAVWLALAGAAARWSTGRAGGAGCARPRRSARPTPRSTSIKLAIGRQRPVGRGPAAPDGHAHRPLVPVLALDVVVRRRARVRRAVPGAPLYCAAAAMALSRLYLGVHYPSDVAAGRGARHARSGASADDEGRHRRDAQRRQVLAVQRALAGGRRGGQLPVHDDRAERRRRAGAPTSASTRWRATVGASNIVPDTIEFHDIAGLVAGAHKGEGLGNKFLANIRETDAMLHVVRAHDDANVIHPEGRVDPAARHRDDRDRAALADLEQAERRHARVVRDARSRRPRGGRRGGVAARR